MLPNVQLQSVSRDDVKRIAEWLAVEDVAERWFGHYECGDPVHRGYEPALMIDASDADWNRLFRDDRQRLIYSVHTEEHGHIGEVQALFDGEGNAELSLLIGRKDLWRHGYGASTAMQLLDRLFSDYPVQRAWVSIPEGNTPALRLFAKLGFVSWNGRKRCTRPDGSPIRSKYLGLGVADYRSRTMSPNAKPPLPLVTVTGAPGSGSERVAHAVSRLLQVEAVDAEITRALCRVLGRSVGELESLESSYRSIWAKFIRAMSGPLERYGTFDASAEWSGALSMDQYVGPPECLTREEYVNGLRAAIASVAADRDAVIHGHGSHLFAPKARQALHVFTRKTHQHRVLDVQEADGTDLKTASAIVRKEERKFVAVHQGLFGIDPMDQTQYDICVSMDHLSVDAAAQLVAGAARSMTPPSGTGALGRYASRVTA
ncbi:MAG: GNAT family N-acetyltransferase [SAR202 cluster bacterium]|nr:GNAT family N-acetyltransferase [SAR202 cluster bacterium]MQG59222.1 GNAT family N-acetyltransferase [SAR202 cluster bacterium]|tara:strand:- start:5477 stop:6766 length:1290 start_codon:yes stop_codon:yes gene_type:complete